MKQPSILAVTAERTDDAIAALTAGFTTDPFNRWMYPQARDYLEYFPKMISLFAGPAIEAGTVFADEDYGATAIWLLQDTVLDDEALGKHFEETVRAEIQGELGELLGQMEEYHHKADPCWYLPVIAADPSRQRRGLGSALLRHALELCDRDGLGAYLESANPMNIPLYERHGFEIVGQIDVGSAPSVFPMMRAPREP